MTETTQVELSYDEISAIVQGLEAAGANSRDFRSICKVYPDTRLATVAQGVYRKLVGIASRHANRVRVAGSTDVTREVEARDPLRTLRDDNADLARKLKSAMALLQSVSSALAAGLAALDDSGSVGLVPVVRNVEAEIREFLD